MKNRGVAIVLVFFLGWLGIHKFYLGNNLAGVLYFLFSWTFIPSLLAIFDFLGLLLMSDQAFNAQYNFISGSSQTVSRFEESSRDKVATLDKLKKLYDNGVITAEEYEEKRRKFLDSL